MSVYEFLRTVAAQLGDDRPNSPFKRYALKDLVAYYNEAMCFVSTHRPDLVTEFLIMKLQPGTYQDAKCCGCVDVKKVVAQIDADGNTIKDLSNVSTGSGGADVSKWYRAPCKTTAGGQATSVVTGITITPGMNGVFEVSPPIKPGEDVWVKLQCVGNGASLDEASVIAGASLGECRFLPAVRSYVLYRALQGNRHATGAAQEAQAEFRNAATYLGLQIKYAEKHEEE